MTSMTFQIWWRVATLSASVLINPCPPVPWICGYPVSSADPETIACLQWEGLHSPHTHPEVWGADRCWKPDCQWRLRWKVQRVPQPLLYLSPPVHPCILGKILPPTHSNHIPVLPQVHLTLLPLPVLFLLTSQFEQQIFAQPCLSIPDLPSSNSYTVLHT